MRRGVWLGSGTGFARAPLSCQLSLSLPPSLSLSLSLSLLRGGCAAYLHICNLFQRECSPPHGAGPVGHVVRRDEAQREASMLGRLSAAALQAEEDGGGAGGHAWWTGGEAPSVDRWGAHTWE